MNRQVLLAAVIVLGGLGALGGGIYWMKHHGGAKPGGMPAGFEPAQTVQVVEARTTSWRPNATLVGTVFALRSIVVANEVSGTVKEVHFDSGSILQKGDPLLTFDTSTEEADLKAAEATIRTAEASHEMVASSVRLAESNWKRVSDALAQRAAAAMDADKAKSELETAKANLDRMSAELDQSRAKAEQMRAVIEKKHIRAPFKCRAGIRLVHPGQYLKEGTEIVSLQGLDDRIYLDFALPQEQAWRVKPGDLVTASSALLGGDNVKIEVVALDSQVNTTTRNVRVRSIVDNKNDSLRPGMSVEISVPIGEPQDYVVAPNLAIRRATFGDHVFVVGPSTDEKDPPGTLRATQRLVKLGASLGADVIVLDGLKPGEKIASDGSFKLHPGAKVAMAEPASGAAPAAGGPGGPKPAAEAQATTR